MPSLQSTLVPVSLAGRRVRLDGGKGDGYPLIMALSFVVERPYSFTQLDVSQRVIFLLSSIGVLFGGYLFCCAFILSALPFICFVFSLLFLALCMREALGCQLGILKGGGLVHARWSAGYRVVSHIIIAGDEGLLVVVVWYRV